MEFKERLDDVLWRYMTGDSPEEESEKVAALIKTDESVKERMLFLGKLANAIRRREHKKAIEKLVSLTEERKINQPLFDRIIFRPKHLMILCFVLMLCIFFINQLFKEKHRAVPIDAERRDTIHNAENSPKANACLPIEIGVPYEDNLSNYSAKIESHNTCYSSLPQRVDRTSYSSLRIKAYSVWEEMEMDSSRIYYYDTFGRKAGDFIYIATEYDPKNKKGEIDTSARLFEGIDVKYDTPLRIWLPTNGKAQDGEDIYFVVFKEIGCYLYVNSPADLLLEANEKDKIPQASANSCVESYYYDGRQPKRRIARNTTLRGRMVAKIKC